VTSASAEIARRLEALLGLGFERAPAPPAETSLGRLDARTVKLVTTRAAMGTHVAVTALGASPGVLEEAAGRALEEMDRLIARLTRFEPASPVSVLNAEGRLGGPPAEVREVVAAALGFHRLSAGAFDVSVAPLLDLFEARLGGPDRAPPTAAEIREARALVGAQHLAVSRRRLAFARPGMRVTLDGIAKGYIVDAVARALDRRGVRRYLVDAGGDIRARGAKEGGAPWTVAVRDPARSAAFPDVIHLANGAVATSGSYERFFDAARAFHHIVDPVSGRSPGHSVSVSVRAPTAMAADALATTVFVMEPQAGLALVERLPGCACLIIDGSGRQRRSRGWISAAPARAASPPQEADA
jgi:thiamine biosynthesis lipoprotein